MRGRRRAVVGLAAGAVVLAATAAASASLIQSPQQAAAEKGPPPANVLTAAVEHRVLRETLVIRGLVSADRTVEVTPAGGGEGVAKAVVTKVGVKPLGAVTPGRMLLEVSGRPVFALRGDVPAYRDLKPGARGDDVKQLQDALKQAGHPVSGDAHGTYGAGTKAAVSALYESMGYEPAQVPGGDLDGARARVKAAQRAFDELRQKDPAGALPPTRYAKEDLVGAQSALVKAESVSGPMVPASEVAFLSGFPARVDSQARVGDTVGEKLMTLSAGDLVVKGTLAAHEERLVRQGQKVRLSAESTGEEFTGTVASVLQALPEPVKGDKTTPTSPAADWQVTVKPDKPLSGRLVGQDVRLTVEAAASKGEVFVVPTTAITAGADGRVTITVLDPGAGRRQVEVLPGMAGDGYVEITPLKTRIAAGERVIVGVKRGGPA
ncbi:peptidoglycan-binding protein [Streptomyces melanogenes]|uniref:peptidoglycan-binding protein n=1 Tax=Streptomyces melanogenes TaxID=67326 RepID=UPI0037A5D5D4